MGEGTDWCELLRSECWRQQRPRLESWTVLLLKYCQVIFTVTAGKCQKWMNFLTENREYRSVSLQQKHFHLTLNSLAFLMRPQTIPCSAPPTSPLWGGLISQNWKQTCGCAVCSSLPISLQHIVSFSSFILRFSWKTTGFVSNPGPPALVAK